MRHIWSLVHGSIGLREHGNDHFLSRNLYFFTEAMPTEFVFPSARPYLLDGILQFGAGPVAPFVEYELDIYYDNVALEDSEVFRLVLSTPSDSRIQIGGRLEDVNVTFYATANVTILDDDSECSIANQSVAFHVLF